MCIRDRAPYEGEDRCVIPSPKVATYDLKPEMSAPEVAAECVKRIESGKYDVVILNFANCDKMCIRDSSSPSWIPRATRHSPPCVPAVPT